MRRQPTLAEILSDDTGKIRAEVADLLMEPDNQRLRSAQQAAVQPRVQRQPFWKGWIIIGVVILLVVIAVKAFNGSRDRHSETMKILEPDNIYQRPVAQIQPPVKVKAVRQGTIIGDDVNIRSQPNLHGAIISKANRDEILKVISFRQGWYEIELPNQSTGYVYGAYLIPKDAESYPYQVVMTRNQNKLLVKEEGNSTHYLAIMPDGKTTWVRKEDVAIVYR